MRAHPVKADLRDEAITLIGKHFAAGRLDENEHQQRLDRVAGARNRAEIRTVFADLPRPHPDTGKGKVRVHHGVFGIIAVCLLVFGTPAMTVVGFSAGLWWPLIATTAGFVVGFGVDARLAARTIRQHNQRQQSVPDSGCGRMRLSTADRERAVPELNHHLEVGHLELTDFENRLAHLTSLTTRADMDRLFVDLPAPHPDLAHVVSPEVAADGNLRSNVAMTIGFAEAFGFACLVVGVPASIVVWVRTGQWYWLPASVVGMFGSWGISDRPRSGTSNRSANSNTLSTSEKTP